MKVSLQGWRIELILPISKYAEWLMWSICFATDRVASMSTPRLLTWLLKEILWLPTLKCLSCDTLTLLRDPTSRASVLSLFSFSLLTVIQLPTESTHCSTSWTSEGKSDGADGLWSWVSSANLWWLHFPWEMCKQSKEYWARNRTLRNPVMKFLLSSISQIRYTC